MKFKQYLLLTPLLIATLLIVPMYGKNDKGNENLKKKGSAKENVMKSGKSGNDKVNFIKDDNSRSNKGNVLKASKSVNYKNHKVNLTKGKALKSPYRYRGTYKNFKNYNHANRYYYRGKFYNFKDYYKFYHRESNVFSYAGYYSKQPNIFIFHDKYGNEFPLYLKPVKRLPWFFRGYPLRSGYGYKMKIKPVRYYPAPEAARAGVYLPFGWGNLNLVNGRYYEMHTSPYLINYNGRLYSR